jgi:hypothetical protein
MDPNLDIPSGVPHHNFHVNNYYRPREGVSANQAEDCLVVPVIRNSRENSYKNIVTGEETELENIFGYDIGVGDFFAGHRGVACVRLSDRDVDCLIKYGY